jgi:hypothetical protein
MALGLERLPLFLHSVLGDFAAREFRVGKNCRIDLITAIENSKGFV